MPRKKKNDTSAEVVLTVSEANAAVRNMTDEPQAEAVPVKEPAPTLPDKQKKETAPEPPKAPDAPKKAKKRKKMDDSVGEERDTHALLLGASQNKRILTGMLDGLEYDEHIADPGQSVRGVINYGPYRVIIPASQMGVVIPEGGNNAEITALYRSYIGAMIGATIDYCILGLDKKACIAIGSRSFAMGILRKQNYVLKQKGMNVSKMQHCFGARIPVDARVMSVSGSVVRLDVSGVECKVFAKEAAWRYTANLSSLFSPGDAVKIILTKLEYNEKGAVSIEGSIREATPNKQTENALRYSVGSLYVGIISGINEKGYYIDIGDSKTGITAFCTAVHGQEVPQMGDKVSCQILKIDESNGFAMAKITRIIQRAIRNKFR